MLTDDAATPIERHGRTWRVPGIDDASAWQDVIQLPDEDLRPFISIVDIMRWCTTPKAINIVLMRLGNCTLSEVKQIPDGERSTLVYHLVARFYGTSGEDVAKLPRPTLDQTDISDMSAPSSEDTTPATPTS